MPATNGPNLGRAFSGRQNELSDPRASRNGNPPQQFRVVVVEVFSDPKSLTTQEKTGLKERVRNPDFVDTMPPNTILGRVVSSGENDAVDSPSIFYPYFQSHIMLPVIAGEHVHVVYEDYEREGSSLGRWVTRIHESLAVEDTNFTHADRRFLNSTPSSRLSDQVQRNAGGGSGAAAPGFPNGGGTPDSITLPPSGSNNGNPYEGIYQFSKASKAHQYEPVPRWTKRPGEFVLQGANNSLIVLGQDRTSPDNTPTSDPAAYAGAVDIVVGRGRYPLTPTDRTAPAEKQTSALVVENTRGKLEVDKTPATRNRQPNIKEGNPDMQSDAARLLVLMNAEADKNLKIQDGAAGLVYPDKTLKPTQPTVSGGRFNRSYVVGKADHIRLVARKATVPAPPSGEIKGTILLLREGVKDQDLAFFYINEQGLVQVEAKEIYFGKSTDKTEPYIKWTKFKETVDNLQAQIDKLVTTITQMGAQLQGLGQASMCVPFLPDPAVTGIGNIVGATASGLNVAAEKQRVASAVTAAKSQKIFGE